MSLLPTPFRAALGLAATVVDDVRHLPDKAIELPMIAVSRALQMSMRAQQRYSALAARGEDILAGNRTTDEAPPWATFDEPVETAVARDEVAPDRPRPRKTVRVPRNSAPSAFDAIGDEQ